jgi:hypothetical protein
MSREEAQLGCWLTTRPETSFVGDILPPLRFLMLDYWRGRFGKHKEGISFLNASDPFVKYRKRE